MAMLPSVFGDWRLPNEAVDDSGIESAVSKSLLIGKAEMCFIHKKCESGLILPLWLPHVTSGDLFTTVYRAIIYGCSLAYLLFGVSIVTDRIVSCCEVMASHKRTKTVKLKSGATTTTLERMWHPAVAYITFGVIGTSSPEILLPVIEIFHRGFQGDELGPSLIVGSGAYHLFLITSICLLSVRDSKAKPIKDLHLFFTTASFAILAYLWVYFILSQISPGEIEVWEAVITLLLFPTLILCVWAIARRIPQKFCKTCSRCLSASIAKNAKKNAEKQRRSQPGGNTSEQAVAGQVSAKTNSQMDEELTITGEQEEQSKSPQEEKRHKLVAMMQRLKKQYPHKSQTEIEEIAQFQLLEDTGKSAAFYRLQATKAISGTRNVMGMEKQIRERMEEQGRTSGPSPSATVQVVGFASAVNTCRESCGTTAIRVTRQGGGILDTCLTLDFETVEGTAKENVNFVPTSGRLVFEPGEHSIEITIQILDDDIYEEAAKYFDIKLSNPIFQHSTIAKLPAVIMGASTGRGSRVSRVDLKTSITRISILDDDHCGVFSFERPEQAIPDNIDIAHIKVARSVGTHSKVAISYKIMAGTARPRQDYLAPSKGTLHFEDGQTEAFIDIKIIDKNRFGEVYTFYVELSPPKKEGTDVKSTIADPKLGDPKAIQIGICEDEELENMLDRLLKMTDLAEYFMSSSWRDQLVDAFTVFRDEDAKESRCSFLLRYLIHFLSFPWKLVVAVLPPVRIGHGWLAYVSLLCLMGVVATLIGDCATHLGCTVGLKNTITAITLIPFGMGLPDTFASRRAAIHEPTADAAIGQITGSNAVTVFLGMGLAWTVGSIYQTLNGSSFRMPPTDFGFSVMLYCTFATACVIVLLLRRLPPIRGELGGPFSVQISSALFFISLWILFVVLSVLKTYCYITGFMSDW